MVVMLQHPDSNNLCYRITNRQNRIYYAICPVIFVLTCKYAVSLSDQAHCIWVCQTHLLTRDTILVIFKAIKECRMQIVPCGFLHEYFYVSVVMIVWIKKVRE